MKAWWKDRAVRVPVFPPLLLLAGMAAGFILDWWRPSAIFTAPGLRHGLGSTLFVAGIAVAFWAERTLRAHQVDPKFQAVPQLVTAGPFRWTRNPMYVGVILTYSGVSILANNAWMWLMLVPATLVLHVAIISREEDYLQDRFGEAFQAYCRSVRRWI